MKEAIFLIFMLMSCSSFSKIELVARANRYNSFRMPEISFVNSSTIAHNTKGDIAFAFSMMLKGEVRSGIWYRKEGKKHWKIVHVAEEGFFLSDPFLNESGDFIFSEFTGGSVKGVYKFDHHSNKVRKIFADLDGRFSSYGNLQLNDDGLILVRGNSFNHSRSVYKYFKGKWERIVSDREKGISYVFGAKLSLYNQVVLKIREGDTRDFGEERPDSLRRYFSESDYDILATDINKNEQSPFKAFNNTPGTHYLSPYVVSITTLKNGNKAIVRFKDGMYEIITEEGNNKIKTLEYFTPSVNQQGHLAFRGIDDKGKRNIYFFDGKKVRSIVSENQLIDTDSVTGRIYSKNGPCFGGGVTLNNKDQVIFQAKVYSKNLEEDLGKAILIAN